MSVETTAEETIDRHHLRGDLHCHTTYSDGKDPLEAMAEGAIQMGYEYLGVTDHALTTHVHSLSQATMERQRAQIDVLNTQLAGRLTILQGAELDIGPDGSLPDLGGEIKKLDYVVASLHSFFELDREQMTARVTAALRHPAVKIFGHPTARRKGIRPPVDMDLEAVFQTAALQGVALEINSTPTRLDLRDDHIRLAARFGCIFSIDTDSHAASGLPRVTLGLELARKAGLSPGQVINCRPLEKLKAHLTKG